MLRFIKWLAILLLVALAALFFWGYAPDTEAAQMERKYGSAASRFAELEPGLRVHYRDEGKSDGRVLVLIHGSNASLHTWEPWVKALGKDYRVISLDLPGHGLTGRNPAGVYDNASYVSVVDRLLTKLNVDNAVIGGNSMGGGVSWLFALTHPEKVDALLLVDASGQPHAKSGNLPLGFKLMRMPVIKEAVRFIAPRSIFESSVKTSMSVQSKINDQLIDRYWELNRYPGNREATMQRFSSLKNMTPGTKERLSAIKAPVLILWGAEDNLIPVTSSKWFAEAIPEAKLVIYPNVGHIPMEEIPEKSANDVKIWLDSLAVKTPKV
ncbi:alpha/beta fold hydrolase [Sphingorhabdus wooponensis]|uniref:Alpha/beta hydrolase n=1 Tax=Sphingorhabdus wooponensis TaxID=940136 RepID=A0A3R8Q9B0_9SPHN|nr:alpha/beta hydrolase [Sphingorhabdus wooponensis]RRQ52460.1 alpha/beta hydrolase [Sphingorhabdus wooponensis]